MGFDFRVIKGWVILVELANKKTTILESRHKPFIKEGFVVVLLADSSSHCFPVTNVASVILTPVFED